MSGLEIILLAAALLAGLTGTWSLGHGFRQAGAPRFHVVAYDYGVKQNILRILTDKNYVSPRQDGRAFIYTPSVSRGEAQTRALKKMMSTFFEG